MASEFFPGGDFVKYYEGRIEPLRHGEVYACNHVLYDACTLFKEGNKGLAVVQKHFNPNVKVMWYGPLDPCLANDIYENPNFKDYFESIAAQATDNIYPTMDVRRLMWALGMRPIKPEPWEKSF